MTLLGIMGPTEAQNDRTETDRSAARTQAAQRAAVGGGLTVGIAVVLAALDVVKQNPKDAFPLLMAWGPKAIGTILLIYVVYDVVKIALNLASRGVRSIEKLAVAQQRLADKDDRQVQEMQTLTSYTAQQSEKSYGLISELATGQAALNAKLDLLLQGNKREG